MLACDCFYSATILRISLRKQKDMLRKRENFKRKRLRKPNNGKAYKMQQVVADFL